MLTGTVVHAQRVGVAAGREAGGCGVGDRDDDEAGGRRLDRLYARSVARRRWLSVCVDQDPGDGRVGEIERVALLVEQRAEDRPIVAGIEVTSS